MEYGFHPEAAAELEAAIAYYDSQQAGLGREFLAEVARGISFIRMFPRRVAANLPKVPQVSNPAISLWIDLPTSRGENCYHRRNGSPSKARILA